MSVSGQTKESYLAIIVKDQLGGTIPNAEIVLNSDKKEKRTKTNNQGIVQFSKLAGGEYQVNIIHKGFVEYKSELIFLKSGETKRIEVVLEVAPVESKVDITNEDSVQADDYGMVTVITQEQIQQMPDDPDEFLKALRRIAGDSITGEDLPIRVNDITGEQIPPKQLIEQIRIDRNAFSAKYAGVGGGGIQIYTSSSVKEFKGFINSGFADSRLNAADPFLGRRAPFQFRNYRFGLSGPLGKKSSFSLTAGRGESDSSSIVNAIILDLNLNPVEYKETFPTTNRNNNLGLIINSDPIKKHKIYFSYNFTQSRGIGQGVGSFSLPERASRSETQGHSLSLSHNYLGSEKLVSRTRFSARYNQNKSFGVKNSPAVNVAEAFSSGGSPSNSSSNNLFFEFANDTTRQFGKLSIEYGLSARYINNLQDSRSNFNGTYNFNGRLAPILDANNDPVVDSEGNFVTEQITSLESYRRTLLFRRLGYSAIRIRELGGGTDQFSISGGNTAISASQIEYDLYLQGSYNLRKNLGVSVGLRYENQNNIKSPFNLAPRLSLIWSPTKKNKDKENVLWSLPRISAGIGFNYSRFGIGNLLSIRQTNDEGRAFYLLSAANAIDPELSAVLLDSFPNAPSIDLLEQLSIPRSRRFFEKGIQTPYDLASNITLNKKLPAKFAAVLSLTHSRGFRRQISRNINAPLAGTFDPLNPLSAVYPFDNTGNIYQISSKGKSEQFRISVNLMIPPVKVWKKTTTLTVNYSYGKSRDDLVLGGGLPFDPYDFSQELAPNINDGVHTVRGNFSQSLPLDFNLGGSWTIRSGTRFNITTGRDSNGDGVYSERPSFTANRNKPGVVKTRYGLLDPNPSAGDKIIPRNLGRGPGNLSFDMYLTKFIGFGGHEKTKKYPKRNLNISMFITNVFNINNKGNPIGNMASPRFVRILSGATNDAADDFMSRSNPRSINFSLGFNF